MDSSANLYKQLVDYDANRKNSVDVLNDSMAKYGIPEIRSRVSGLRTTLSNTENALNAVDPSVTGRTQGSLVTEAQRQRQVANERAPITEQYGQQSRALQTESANLSDNLSAAQLIAQNQISDYDKGRAAISDRYNMALGAENEQRRREEADRTFKAQQAAAAGYNINPNPNPAPSTPSGATMTRRSNGGFNFTNQYGNPMSAAQYAASKNMPFRDLLQMMAREGDKGAAAALGFVGNDFGYDPGKIGGNSALYNSLVWGTGKSYKGSTKAGGGGGGGGW